MTFFRDVARDQNPTLRWVYLALVVLGSIGAHLASEFAAMGSDAGEVLFSVRHIYLGLAGLAALAFAVRELMTIRLASSNPRDFKRRIEMGLTTLPFAGKLHFGPVTAVLFLLIGGATEIGEGCPLCGHDVGAGVAGAVLCSALLALIVRVFTRRLPSIAAAIEEYVPAPHDVDSDTSRERVPATAPLPQCVWFPQLFNRPPPVPAASR
jgi:hypothetical protein